MARQVLLHDDFLRDARRHEAWLVRNGQEAWLANLLSDVEEIAALLQDFPAVGTVVAEDERIVVRSFPFRRYPYVVWFAYRRREPIGDVWLVRLFGGRQNRPEPDAASWRLPSERTAR